MDLLDHKSNYAFYSIFLLLHRNIDTNNIQQQHQDDYNNLMKVGFMAFPILIQDFK